MSDIYALFHPQSIAVVGASADQSKIGHIIVRNLQQSGYTGKIYPVNPKAKKIASLPAYSSLLDIPDPVDQVTICIPASGVLDIVQQCATKKIKSIIIISAGFSETGTDNSKLQDTISDICKTHNITLIGPNVIGIISPLSHLNNSWMQLPVPAGNIAFISQSGALCCSVLDVAARYGLGFSHFCSLGNKAGVDELDLIKYFMDDADTDVIALYLEDIHRGYQLVRFLRERVDKPVILFHSGKTSAAATAALSHTGSMTSDRDLQITAITAAGLIEAKSINEFYLLLQAFSRYTLPKDQNPGQFAIITNAGGAGIIATDEIISAGYTLAELSDDTINDLRAVLPAAASVTNPIDILGDALPDRYLAAANIIGHNTEVDIILFILTPQHVTQPLETAQVIADFAASHPEKLVLSAFLGDESVRDAREYLAGQNLLVYSDVHDAVATAAGLARHSRYLYDHHDSQVTHDYRLIERYHHGKYHALIDALIDRYPHSIQILSDHLVAALCHEVGLTLPPQQVVTRLEEAQAFAANLYPVVIKAPNQSLAHKTEEGAVITNIRDERELTTAFTALQQRLALASGDASHFPSILIQQMVQGSELEFFIGAKRDGNSFVYDRDVRGFGHLITFGQGGITTELSRDLSRLLVPQRRRLFKQGLWQTKIWPLIEGYRGAKPLPEPKIVDALLAVQQLVLAYPEICAIDINPLIITKDAALAVDVKIFISR